MPSHVHRNTTRLGPDQGLASGQGVDAAEEVHTRQFVCRCVSVPVQILRDGVFS